MGCLTETGKDSSALRDSSSVTWRGAGEAIVGLRGSGSQRYQGANGAGAGGVMVD